MASKAKAAKAQSKSKEGGAHKQAGGARYDRRGGVRGKGEAKEVDLAGRSPEEVGKVQQGEDGGRAGAGNGAWGSGVMQVGGRERNLVPPPLPVPIATFNI